ncbi:MAG TPA: HD-GYP domain-containing protein [Clostridia bacterium]|nr:HD-GYP domain-containing protein [Clostridia bacterium]
MRFVPANCLRTGQVLASDLVLNKNRILIGKNVRLTDALIENINAYGFQGVYIDDDISEDLHIANVISDELKTKAKREVRTMFTDVEAPTLRRGVRNVDTLKGVVTNIVEEVIYNREAIVNVVDIRSYDDYTYSHSLNVAVIAGVLGGVLNLNRKDLNDLVTGALVHDIGKVFIDKRIINKVSRLTHDELEEVRRHSRLGYDYILNSDGISDASKMAVLTHHERFDGYGYPSGRKGREIPLFGRIICVADVYDALVSDRPYRRAMLPSDALEYIMSGYGTMFDPDIVDAFTKRIAPYPVGTCVRLSSGVTGIVVGNYEHSRLRPIIRVIKDGKLTSTYIDLAEDHSTLNTTIVELVNL